MARILLVEDSEAIILGLEYLLKSEGFSCEVARTYQEAFAAFSNQSFDLAVLDVGLPDGDGFMLCQEIKKIQELPVIFLTAKEEEDDVVTGFSLGADDYIVKPFRNRELISRIRNVLRRMGKDNDILQCRDVKLDANAGKVFLKGEEIALTKLEYKILFVMMSHKGKLFTREEILASIWDMDGNFVNDNTLSVTMKRLREKIGDKDAVLIKTVRGMGYRIEKE